MFVDIEMFSENPIDNVISCLKLKYDKVIFLGCPGESIKHVSKATISHFLKSAKIGINEIEFIELPDLGYATIKKILSEIVHEETISGNQCYVDLTGGDEVVVAMMGAIAYEYELPMHEVSIEKDELHIMCGGEKYEMLPKHNIYVNIEEYLNLHEAVIDWERHKSPNDIFQSSEYKDRVIQIYRYATSLGKKWNRLCSGLANMCKGQHGRIFLKYETIVHAAQLAGMNTNIFHQELENLYKNKILKAFHFVGNSINIEFFNDAEQAVLCNPGAILEHYACVRVIEDSDVNDFMVGCFMNWEGDGNPEYKDIYGDDVINEIDVVYMKKNIPTFISCKNKHVIDNKDLYELETVANRFGGEKVRKILFAKDGTSPSIQNRANEMNIEVITHM